MGWRDRGICLSYDPSVNAYKNLLYFFFLPTINYFELARQWCDKQDSSVIFYVDEEQQLIVQLVMEELDSSTDDAPIFTGDFLKYPSILLKKNNKTITISIVIKCSSVLSPKAPNFNNILNYLLLYW